MHTVIVTDCAEAEEGRKRKEREREKRRQGCVRVLATSGPPQINYESRERVSIKRER